MVWFVPPTPSQVRTAVQTMLEAGLDPPLPLHTPENRNPGRFLISMPDMLQWLDRFDSPEQISVKERP
jgi:hypothetical protein